MDFTKLAGVNLRKGAGNGDVSAGLCLMEMASYFAGENITDRPACACPMLTSLGIALNDTAPSKTVRDSLKPLIPRLVGSRDDAARAARAAHVFWASIERAAIPYLRGRGRSPLAHALSRACEARDVGAVERLCEAGSVANGVTQVLSALRNGAYHAPRAGAIPSYWVTVGIYAFQAVVCAHQYATPSAGYWNIGKTILEEALALGKHGELDPLYIVVREHSLMEAVKERA